MVKERSDAIGATVQAVIIAQIVIPEKLNAKNVRAKAKSNVTNVVVKERLHALIAMVKVENNSWRTHNNGFSAMLASEYILIEISLISCSPIFTNITEL